jgi:diguanylate cyclase (GGDEF)-like protein
MPMMLSAIVVVTYVLYHVGPARAVFLLMFPVILFFGVFRLTARKLMLASTAILAGYAAVIALLLRRPQGLEQLHIEILQWAVLAAVLFWFSFMGGYVYDLRKRLRQSRYDELTGVYTRRRILEIFAHEMIRSDRGSAPLSICLVDIDLFKEIIDSFGHRAGDAVLQKFVRVAQAELRSIDFIGRHGGDEFLLILTQAALEGARECAERIRKQSETTQPYISGLQRRITVSIGAARYRSGETLSDTLERADAALYRAKALGRNRVEHE